MISSHVSYHGSAIAHLPTFESVRSALYRTRKSRLPVLPCRLEDIALPREHTHLNEQQFLCIDDGDVSRILMFGLTENLILLYEADIVYGDGTFYAARDLFRQIYTLHAMCHGATLPLVYALLPSKTEETYTRILT